MIPSWYLAEFAATSEKFSTLYLPGEYTSNFYCRRVGQACGIFLKGYPNPVDTESPTTATVIRLSSWILIDSTDVIAIEALSRLKIAWKTFIYKVDKIR